MYIGRLISDKEKLEILEEDWIRVEEVNGLSPTEPGRARKDHQGGVGTVADMGVIY